MKDILIEFKKRHQEILPVVRGNIPIVKHTKTTLLENIVGSILIFIISGVFLGSILGVRGGVTGAFCLTALFLYWPYYII
jgi:hypothetical protein